MTNPISIECWMVFNELGNQVAIGFSEESAAQYAVVHSKPMKDWPELAAAGYRLVKGNWIDVAQRDKVCQSKDEILEVLLGRYGPVELYDIGMQMQTRAQKDMTDSIIDLDNERWKQFEIDQNKTSRELVEMSENGEGLENYCPICYAEPLQMCSVPDPDQEGLGIELTRRVHKARLFVDSNS